MAHSAADTSQRRLSSVLWLGGEETDRARVVRDVAQAGAPVVPVDTLPQLMDELRRRPTSLCVIEVSDDANGRQSLREVRAHYPSSVPVALVGRTSSDAVIGAFEAGAFDLLTSPVAVGELAAVIRNAEEFLALASAGSPAPANEGDTGIVALGPSMRRVVELVRRLGPARCNVTLSGESGTGREALAGLLHRYSGRAHAPLVKVDCAGALVSELKAELFGSGGDDSRLFPATGGATLYLEHLAEMPPPVQARLARCLRRTQGSSTVDTRVILAADPNIGERVREGHVRSDLYQLLSVVGVDVPPLRRRGEDIPVVSRQMLEELCEVNGTARKTVTRSALTLLSALPWPGNLPELRALLERLVVMVPGGVIRLEDVLAHVSLNGSDLRGPDAGGTLREARERFERDYIAATLRRHRGRMAEAARALGMQRTNLYRKVRLLNLSRRGA